MRLTAAQVERLRALLASVERDVEREEVDLDGEPIVRLGPAADGAVVATVTVSVHGMGPARLRPACIHRDGSLELAR